MSSDGEDYGDFEDDAFAEVLIPASQSLPSPRKPGRPSKRRRISNSDSDSIDSYDDEVEDVDDSDNDMTRRQLSADEDLEERAPRLVDKKRSKYKIHIPKNNAVPPMQIQYGTQISVNPDSSPYRIRGAKWKLPKKVIPSDTATQRPWSVPVANISRQSLHPGPKSNTAISPVTIQEDGVSELHMKPDFSRFGLSSIDIAQELADLPSDAFSSSPEKEFAPSMRSIGECSQPSQRLIAPQKGLRQTTLFGGQAPVEHPPSQINKVHNYRVDAVPEAPTHHKLDQEALRTWVYPTNLGATRDYQFNIVKLGLFHNTLVALPTGLGKTFIAATIMLNYFRWTKDAQIVFMAPTKPLVSQQVDACFNIVGIPRSATTMLTGEISPGVRAEEWQQKRVFFMTPQTLDNDLRTGICDPKRIALLVVDEAHRAKGEYAYVKVVTFLRRFSNSFRVLALTATPGSTVEAVQEVIDGLHISKVEIRTEESMDIQQFTHIRETEQIVLEPSDEINMVKDLFGKALQPLVNDLCGGNAYWNRDPMSITPYGLMQAQKQWFSSDTGRRAHPGLQHKMRALFQILASLAHGIKLLNYHGIGPFYETIKAFRSDVEDKGQKGSKYKKQINENPNFQKMMDRIKLWINKDDFVGHPKLTYLCDTVLNHFLDAGEGRLPDGAPPSSTRVIVFSEFRDSAEDIVRVLNRHGPMIRASVFVGQADSKRSEGMNQAKQMETINQFKTGVFNVIVATSIGEEGLDIGQVDLIVCYDASGSPIRMLQRMGRTGRKRAGKIVLLLMKGKEQENFEKAKDNYEQMQKMIASGTRFNFRHDLSMRIVPKEILPVVDKRQVDIPIENTQNPSLPEPKRQRSKATKRPPKKFHMPDGVQTGFLKASKLVEVSDDDSGVGGRPQSLKPVEEEAVDIPSLDCVLLSSADLRELERNYQNVSGERHQEVGMPEMNRQPISQRSLRPAKFVKHGQATKRLVKTITAMNDICDETIQQWQQIQDNLTLQEAHKDHAVSSIHSSIRPLRSVEGSETETPPRRGKRVGKRKQQQQIMSSTLSDDSDVESGSTRTNSSDREGPSISVDTEDPSDSDDTLDDDDADLEGFIVDDSAPLYRGKSTSICSSSPTGIHSWPKKPFFELSHFSATQETNDDDDELPDLETLVKRKSTSPARVPLKESRINGNAGQSGKQRAKRRRVVEEEDSDE